MTFKEFYMLKHGMTNWGNPGEYIHDVFERMADTYSEYIDEHMMQPFRDTFVLSGDREDDI